MVEEGGGPEAGKGREETVSRGAWEESPEQRDWHGMWLQVTPWAIGVARAGKSAQ